VRKFRLESPYKPLAHLKCSGGDLSQVPRLSSAAGALDFWPTSLMARVGGAHHCGSAWRQDRDANSVAASTAAYIVTN